MAEEPAEPASSDPPANPGFAKGLQAALVAGSRWKGSLASFLLTGEYQPDYALQTPWTLEDCQKFEVAGVPAWLLG